MNSKKDESAVEYKGADYLFMVGTHHMQFARLIAMADRFVSENNNQKVLVQYGQSCPPNVAAGVENLSHEQMDGLSGQLKGVVLSGGPSLMLEWLRRGLKPVVVPRDPKRNEHIDEHQIRFSNFMAARQLITLANSYEEVSCALLNPSQVPRDKLALLDKDTAVENFALLAEELLRRGHKRP